MGNFTEKLAEFSSKDLVATPQLLEIGRLSALDWLACGVAGVSEPVSGVVRSIAVAEGGEHVADLFGGGGAPARMAALVNGTISHALDYDDTHFAHIGHPSVAVFSASFAVGQQLGRSLPQVLLASLFGMEVSVRVGQWLGRSHYQAGFHQTATAGAFGSGVAAGRLHGFDTSQMAQVLGLAATRAAGLKAHFGTMGKPYNAGIAASTGVEVAQLIQAGFVANPHALEGEFGFGASHQGADATKTALSGLGQKWMMEHVNYKFHACCHGLHAALEAARKLDLAAPEIAEIRVRTHPCWMSVCNQLAPDTGLGAKFSFRTVLAMQALGLDTAKLDTYSDSICRRQDLQALRNCIYVDSDDTLAETEAVVSLLRRDGQRLEVRHDLQSLVDRPEKEQRVRTKVASLLGEVETEKAWKMLHQDLPATEFAKQFS
ncbi:MmgE/PrpD family protein [Parasedimentitalea huanghaiensis]|uniref:MmgE/PrpD family protein n=1 Tax=Parasedimentitalea huanghaiensis TaxID=2682100 RepID=A0A6L6WAZ2_9RHOB|nr:MmgE/PrpD family protein [Zongyanglinia huanghaiensis]